MAISPAAAKNNANLSEQNSATNSPAPKAKANKAPLLLRQRLPRRLRPSMCITCLFTS